MSSHEVPRLRDQNNSMARAFACACFMALLAMAGGCGPGPEQLARESAPRESSDPVTVATNASKTDFDEGAAPQAVENQPSLAEILLSSEGNLGGPTLIAEPDLQTPELSDDLLSRFQLRSLKGTHLTLITDLESDPEVDELPQVFDLAVPAWAKYFKVPEAELLEWHQVGYLMSDRERFIEAGLLPETLPNFLHGYHAGDQLWVLEQPSAYYRRHLVLHEGVHGFMKFAFNATGPPWYREGMAELLATHRWSDNKLEIGVVPRSREEVPEWGRIKLIRDEFAAGRGLMLRNVAVLGDTDFLDVESYAWSWAACAYLDGHPDYRERFREMRRHLDQPPLAFNEQFNKRLEGELRELDEQWQLFVMNADYGYDFERNAIRYRRGKPFPVVGVDLAIDTDRGWQSSGYRLLAGKNYLVTAEGRFQIKQSDSAWMSEPNGITLRYHAGMPLGLLVGNVRREDENIQVTNLARPIRIGLGRRVRPTESGVLYLKINDHPGELVDNVGSVNVRIVEVE